MIKTASKKSLLDAYQFPGFKTHKAAKGKFGDKHALVLTLSRRSKKVCASAVNGIEVGMIARPSWPAIYRAAIVGFIFSSRSDVFAVARTAR